MTKKIMATLFFMTLFSNAFADSQECEALKKEHSELREEFAPLHEKIESGKANIKEVNAAIIIRDKLDYLSRKMRDNDCLEYPSLIGNKA